MSDERDDGLEQRTRLTKLLADLDLLFSISYFNKEANVRTWSLTFDIGGDASATVQLAFFEGFLSVFNALQVDSDLDPEILRKLLYLNASGPTGSFSVSERAILASASIPASHLDIELLKGCISGVLRLAGEARKLLTEADVTFRERTRS